MLASRRRTRTLAAAVVLAAVTIALPPLLAAPAEAANCPLLGPCPPPESQITTKPSPITSSPAVRFDVTTVEPESGTKFDCKLEGPAAAHDFEPCTDTPAPGATTSTGSRVYVALVPGDYTFTVRATGQKQLLGAPRIETTPETYAWSVVETTEPDGTEPNTTITKAAKRWHLFRFIGVNFTSNEPTVGYVCKLNDKPIECGNGQAIIFGMKSTDHVFSVAAIDTSGNIDPTPDTAKWTVPRNEVKLRGFSKGWKKHFEKGYFLDNYRLTQTKGASLTTTQDAYRSAALITTKCPSCGTVDVFHKGKLIKQINLHSATRKQRRAVNIVSWKKIHSGSLRFVVTSRNKAVLVEGIGFSLQR